MQVDGADPAKGVSPAQPCAAIGSCRPEEHPQDFRKTLRRPARPDGPTLDETRGAAAAAGWFRAELTGASMISASDKVRTPQPIERLLIGRAGDSTEARIRIGEGALAGAELRFVTGASGVVTAELLTASNESRQTLSLVMNEIRLRLRGKGIAFSMVRGRVVDSLTDGASREGGRAVLGGMEK